MSNNISTFVELCFPTLLRAIHANARLKVKNFTHTNYNDILSSVRVHFSQFIRKKGTRVDISEKILR